MKNVINCTREHNPLINQKLKEVTVEEGNAIATELFQILNKRKDGIGLAANQVGINAQVAVVNVREPLILINPKIISMDKEIPFLEGCLSYPGKSVNTKRYSNVVISTEQSESEWVFDGATEDNTVNLKTLEAVCIQHEIDHLNGLVCMDRRIDSTIRVEKKIGRNHLVTIKKGDVVKVLKYKKIKMFLNDGWILQ